MPSVSDYARALAKALRESDERRTMKTLAAKVSKDQRLERLLSDLRGAQFAVQSAQIQGQQPRKEHVEQLQKLGKTLEAEPALREYLSAEQAYGQLLMEVQNILSDEFNPTVPGALRQK